MSERASDSNYPDLIPGLSPGGRSPRTPGRGATRTRGVPPEERPGADAVPPEGEEVGGAARPTPAPSSARAALVLPSGLTPEAWVDRAVARPRDPTAHSGPAISDFHHDLLDEIKRALKKRGYSLRQVSYRNVNEMSVELFYEVVFGERPR